VEQAAARANLDVAAVRSLEEGCLYRLGSNVEAVATALVYATSLGVSQREARQLAGLPVRPLILDPWVQRRLVAVLAFAAACVALLWFVLRPELTQNAVSPTTTVVRNAPPPLPARWEIEVDVYNGTRLGNAAAGIANEVAGLAYRIGAVEDAHRRDYAKTLVYYPPGGEAVAKRLARELGVGVLALPGGDDPSHLVVIVGRD
jgi:alkylation response protein AidB-like acyl-CoA dehydrogenase